MCNYTDCLNEFGIVMQFPTSRQYVYTYVYIKMYSSKYDYNIIINNHYTIYLR